MHLRTHVYGEELVSWVGVSGRGGARYCQRSTRFDRHVVRIEYPALGQPRPDDARVLVGQGPHGLLPAYAGQQLHQPLRDLVAAFAVDAGGAIFLVALAQPVDGQQGLPLSHGCGMMTSNTTNLGALTPFARRWEIPSYSLEWASANSQRYSHQLIIAARGPLSSTPHLQPWAS